MQTWSCPRAWCASRNLVTSTPPPSSSSAPSETPSTSPTVTWSSTFCRWPLGRSSGGCWLDRVRNWENLKMNQFFKRNLITIGPYGQVVSTLDWATFRIDFLGSNPSNIKYFSSTLNKELNRAQQLRSQKAEFFANKDGWFLNQYFWIFLKYVVSFKENSET